MSEQKLLEAPKKAAPKQEGEYLIVVEGKRTVKTSISGAMIETLKRAGEPLPLAKLAARVKGTKAGRNATVKDVKARVRKCADWYVKNTAYVEKTDDGYSLVRADA